MVLGRYSMSLSKTGRYIKYRSGARGVGISRVGLVLVTVGVVGLVGVDRGRSDGVLGEQLGEVLVEHLLQPVVTAEPLFTGKYGS